MRTVAEAEIDVEQAGGFADVVDIDGLAGDVLVGAVVAAIDMDAAGMRSAVAMGVESGMDQTPIADQTRIRIGVGRFDIHLHQQIRGHGHAVAGAGAPIRQGLEIAAEGGHGVADGRLGPRAADRAFSA